MLALGMHPADGVAAGARMVILTKLAGDSSARVLLLAVSLKKEPTIVTKNVRLDDDNVG
jgi:hypothetical protein